MATARETHIQDDLTPELFDERYPGYTRIFEIVYMATTSKNGGQKRKMKFTIKTDR